jgi:S-adenosylhomocysteine hydrolase
MSDGHRRAQTVIQNILRLTNLLMAGKRVAVLGHEPELAARLRAMGAQTLVTDPAGALHGHRVLPVEKALPIADLVVGARGEHLSLLRDGAILATVEPSADLFAVPVGTTAEPSAGLSAAPVGTRVRDGITAYRLDADREVFVLDGAYGPDRGEASVPDGAYGPEPGREVFVLDRAC